MTESRLLKTWQQYRWSWTTWLPTCSLVRPQTLTSLHTPLAYGIFFCASSKHLIDKASLPVDNMEPTAACPVACLAPRVGLYPLLAGMIAMKLLHRCKLAHMRPSIECTILMDVDDRLQKMNILESVSCRHRGVT